MRIFLTGATGLVGSHTLDLLVAGGHSLVCTVRSETAAALVRRRGATPVHGTVEDPALWRSVDADAIVHAAALLPGAEATADFGAINVTATRLAGETAIRTGARLVHLSSVAVYGPAGYGRGDGPIDENTPHAEHRPEDLYGRSKRAAEAALWDAVKARPECAIALRPCVIYGEHDRLFVPRILKAMRFRLWPLAGRGTNSLAVVYAGNVAQAVVGALEHHHASGAFNVANEGEISQRDFFRELSAAAGGKLHTFPVPGTVAHAAALAFQLGMSVAGKRSFGDIASVAARWLGRDNPYSSARAMAELGWQASVGPVDAVRRTGRWFAENRGA